MRQILLHLCLVVWLASVVNAAGKNVTAIDCHPENGEFLCKDGHECIGGAKFCDKKADCSDGSDEFSGCDVLCKELKCQHGCLPDPDEPDQGMCTCNPGFKITGRNRDKCENVNECVERWGVCSQRCSDTVGSFKCSCIEGFELQANNITCAPRDQNAKMLFAVKSGIRSITLATRKEKVIVERSGQTIGVSVDVARGYVYWTDVTDRLETIYRAKVDATNPQAEVIVDTGLILAEGVAFDWVADNVYFTDSNLSHIGVCDKDGKSCTILIQEKLDKPREIALLPQEALLFWTDWGIQPSIMRAGMDGSSPVAIIGTDLQWPNGITIDFGTMRLYWIDAAHDKIESSNLEGGDRRLIRESAKSEHGFSLEIFGDNLYWSDWGFDRISSANKFHGDEEDSLVAVPKNLINGLALYHSTAQPKLINPCGRSPCSHICVLATKLATKPYRCLCPFGMVLSSDSKTCKDDQAKAQLFIAHESSLKRMYFNAIGHDVLQSKTLEGMHTISAITYNRLNDTFILFDTYRKHIFTYIPQTHKVERLVARHLEAVKGLDVDVVAQNLYWVDAGRRKVEVFSLITGSRLNIYHETQDVLVDIVVVPEHRSIFVAAYDDFSGKIMKMTMDGATVDIIVQTSRGIPSSIAYHPEYEHIFWSDISRGTIEHATIDGHQRFMGVEEIGSPYTMTVHGNKMYWIERSNKALKSMIIGSNSRDAPVNLRSANRHLNESLPGNFSAYLGVRNPDLSSVQDLIDSHPCSPTSKSPLRCSHICVLEEEDLEAKCLCPEGMVLGSDGKTCENLDNCNQSLFQCTGSCVPLEAKCDGFRDCPGGEDELNCQKNITCRPMDFVCKTDNTCIQGIWRCDGERDCRDGSDEEGCEIKTCTNERDFRCKLGRCIPQSWRCDHVVDCPDTDASDEENCTYTCQADEFKCKGSSNQECISAEWVCDGEEDCEDGSDEHGDCFKECKDDQFKCVNRQCIRRSKVCNGRDDCGDGSDEASCEAPLSGRSAGSRGRDRERGSTPRNASTTVAPRTGHCPSDQFWCLSGECISLSKVCDRKADCFDESDESEVCEMPCGMANECSDKCVRTPTGPKCSCSAGFRLAKDNKSCEDIDECQENVCHQYCQNLKGGFKCTCHDEYSPIPSDHKRCKPRGNPPNFVYEWKSTLYVTPHDMQNATPISLPPGTRVSGMDVDVHTGAIFFTNSIKGTISRMYNNGSHQEPETLISGLSSPHEIAYDWITGNAYVVCNTAAGREMPRNLVISICNLGKDPKKRQCTILHHLPEVHRVTSIGIAPNENSLFWSQLIYTNYGAPKGTIVRANMDRPGMKFIAIDKVYQPMSVAVDHVYKRVMWIDMESKNIEAVNFDGKRRVTIISSDEKKVSETATGLALFDNWVIWNDLNLNIRCRVDMQTLDCMHIRLKDVPQTRFSAIMQRTVQPAGANPCADHTCDFICAGATIAGPYTTSSSASSSLSYKCFCPTGYDNLDDHHRRCEPKPKGRTPLSPIRPIPRRPASIWKLIEDQSSEDDLGTRNTDDDSSNTETVHAEHVETSSATAIAVTVIVIILLVIIAVGAVIIYRQQNGRPKLSFRPVVQHWVKYVNDPVQRWRNGRREQLVDHDAYAQVYEARQGQEPRAYTNPVYDDAHNLQSKSAEAGKGERSSYPDSGILTLNDNEGYEYEDDVQNGHYVSYSQTDTLIDKEFV